MRRKASRSSRTIMAGDHRFSHRPLLITVEARGGQAKKGQLPRSIALNDCDYWRYSDGVKRHAAWNWLAARRRHMRPMAAAAVGALISGIAVYAVNARAAQPFTEMPAFVQTVDGRYIQVPDARTVGFAAPAVPAGFVTTPGYVTTQPAA